MYNVNSTSYSVDKRSLYLTVGIASLSLISYSEPNNIAMEFSNPETYIHSEEFKADELHSEMTNHAMNLAQASLEEDWRDENDEHWASFL